MEQKDLGRLQSDWQAATRKNHDAIKQDNTIQIQESTNLKKAIVNQFAFVEEKKRGVHGGAAMPWGHTKAASTANPPQARSRLPTLNRILCQVILTNQAHDIFHHCSLSAGSVSRWDESYVPWRKAHNYIAARVGWWQPGQSVHKGQARERI